MRLLVDEQPAAELKTAERVVLHIPIGDRILSVKPICPLGGRGLAEVSAHVAADVPLSFRIGVTSSGDVFIDPTRY